MQHDTIALLHTRPECRVFLSRKTGKSVMSKRCDVCGKGPQVGKQYTFLRSHFNPHGKRRWLPNLQPFKAAVGNTVKRLKVCTSCIKAGKVQRAL